MYRRANGGPATEGKGLRASESEMPLLCPIGRCVSQEGWIVTAVPGKAWPCCSVLWWHPSSFAAADLPCQPDLWSEGGRRDTWEWVSANPPAAKTSPSHRGSLLGVGWGAGRRQQQPRHAIRSALSPVILTWGTPGAGRPTGLQMEGALSLGHCEARRLLLACPRP